MEDITASESDSVDRYIEFFNALVLVRKDEPEAVSAVDTMLYFIKTYKTETMVELQKKMREIIEKLVRIKVSMSVISACELFVRFITLSSMDNDSFSECQRLLIQRGEMFVKNCINAKTVIGHQAQIFIKNGWKILTHSKSRVVLEIFKCAMQNDKLFEVFVPETRADMSGVHMNELLKSHGIKSTLILDSAVGYVMERIDAIFIGCDGVVESGGMLSRVGAYQMAVLARHAKVPVFVAVETFKFVRFYPFKQIDVPNLVKYDEKNRSTSDHPSIDYTPPELIKFFVTDIGVLTPTAVSDELIKLYF
ncbi:Translation initiation factor eIF-2B subunit alpha [Thelohanellus kitauei]|uniref:Translation initiation factor eIF2B subunit alpha n=1 Tax=Thelohanellus kitauei TaxID=669202 RepID=A0A0C2JDP1_THEKT|nr:Translation initiation factor eIF-2B subunit alpha [Thelohanellus kitauei]